MHNGYLCTSASVGPACAGWETEILTCVPAVAEPLRRHPPHVCFKEKSNPQPDTTMPDVLYQTSWYAIDVWMPFECSMKLPGGIEVVNAETGIAMEGEFQVLPATEPNRLRGQYRPYGQSYLHGTTTTFGLKLTVYTKDSMTPLAVLRSPGFMVRARKPKREGGSGKRRRKSTDSDPSSSAFSPTYAPAPVSFTGAPFKPSTALFNCIHAFTLLNTEERAFMLQYALNAPSPSTPSSETEGSVASGTPDTLCPSPFTMSVDQASCSAIPDVAQLSIGPSLSALPARSHIPPAPPSYSPFLALQTTNWSGTQASAVQPPAAITPAVQQQQTPRLFPSAQGYDAMMSHAVHSQQPTPTPPHAQSPVQYTAHTSTTRTRNPQQLQPHPTPQPAQFQPQPPTQSRSLVMSTSSVIDHHFPTPTLPPSLALPSPFTLAAHHPSPSPSMFSPEFQNDPDLLDDGVPPQWSAGDAQEFEELDAFFGDAGGSQMNEVFSHSFQQPAISPY